MLGLILSRSLYLRSAKARFPFKTYFLMISKNYINWGLILFKHQSESHSFIYQTRNAWAHAVIQDWDEAKFQAAFADMEDLAKQIPNSTRLIDELRKTKCQGEKFSQAVATLKSLVANDQFDQIKRKLKKLEDDNKEEVYLKRTFKNTQDGVRTTNIEDMMSSDKVTLLKGDAGAGKSTIAVKLMQQWAKKMLLNNTTLTLFFSAGSDMKIPLNRLVWSSFSGVSRWKEEDFEEAFICLIELAHEGRLSVVIDGLDEFGSMSQTTVTIARDAASYPSNQIDVTTLCAGILARKILPGAKVLATGRSTEIINKEVMNGEGRSFDLVTLEEEDREKLVSMMVKDPNTRTMIIMKLKKIAVGGNDLFLRTPLMTRCIIQLNVGRNVKLENTQNSTELYLMILLNNLDFHQDVHDGFTILEPPEDQQHLINTLFLCQDQVQTGKADRPIKGSLSLKSQEEGMCFETIVSAEKIRISIAFLKKIGIFEIQRDGVHVFLEVIHLSFLEFCAAASLCRKGVNLEEELDKIKSLERFTAVISYISGMFSNNQSIEFLKICRGICSNFLQLVGTTDTGGKVQRVYASIIARKENKSQSKL